MLGTWLAQNLLWRKTRTRRTSGLAKLRIPVGFHSSLPSTASADTCTGLEKAEYAVGYFTEMGIGCRRDPLEANVWYVKAADSGDERAKARLAAIRQAASGTAPMLDSSESQVGGRTKKSGDKECTMM